MAISGNLPNHLVVAARTGILSAVPNPKTPWRRVAMEIDLTASTTTLVDLGGMPYPTQDAAVVQSMIEKSKTVTPEDWNLTLHISDNAVRDDQTASLLQKFQNLMPAYDKHINSRVFTVLNAGDGQTYGACYDGQDFFDSDHVDKGAHYTTNQDNEATLTLSLDNFNTAWVAANAFVDDQGQYTQYNYNLLVCHPTNNVVAANITGNTDAMDTGNREVNPYAGNFSYIMAPELDTNAWYIIAESESVKPLYVAFKKRPQLQEIWFDPQQPDGGMHYFKYHARYVVGYGDWRLAYQGQT